MIIKNKLRPKELNEFNRYFGDLKNSIKQIKKEKWQEEIIENKVISSNVVLVTEQLFTQKVPKELQAVHNKILLAIMNEMNTVQKQQITMYCRLQRNAYMVLYGEDLVKAEEYSQIDMIILDELLDKIFITDIRKNKYEIEPNIEIGIFDLEIEEITESVNRYNNFKQMELPAEAIKKAKELNLTEGEISDIKFYYLVLLDILVNPLLENAILLIKFNKPLCRCLNRIIQKMDSEYREFWQEATKYVKNMRYKEDKEIERAFNEFFECGDTKYGKKLLKENKYFNISTGIILENKLQIMQFLRLEKDEKNIVINEVVKIERMINKIILERFENFMPEMLYDPEKYEYELKDLINIMCAFKFSKKTIEMMLVEKGLSKQDWYFFYNMTNIVVKDPTLVTIYRKYREEDPEDFFVINDLAVSYNLNTVATVNVNSIQLCKYIMAYAMAIEEKNAQDQELIKMCNEYFIESNRKTRVNFDKEIMLSAQRKHGVSEARINLFTFFINKIL